MRYLFADCEGPTGKIFDRSVLDEVKRYLIDQYFSQSKYVVRIDTKITELPGNKVDVIVDIKEGKRAKVEQINPVGIGPGMNRMIVGFRASASNYSGHITPLGRGTGQASLRSPKCISSGR